MTLKEALSCDGILISDGGMGTELLNLGLGSTLGEEWNLAHPDRVKSVHQHYVNAGAQLITTNTFSANRFVLAKHGLLSKQAEIARTGAAIAKEVINGHGWVLGSVGPCGDFLKPLGKVIVAELEDSLRVQIGALL